MIDAVLALVDSAYVYLFASIALGSLLVHRYAQAVIVSEDRINWGAFPQLFFAAQGLLSGFKVLIKIAIVAVWVLSGAVPQENAFGFFGPLDYVFMAAGGLCALGVSAVGIWHIFNEAS